MGNDALSLTSQIFHSSHNRSSNTILRVSVHNLSSISSALSHSLVCTCTQLGPFRMFSWECVSAGGNVYYPHPEELREGPDGRGTNVHHGLAPTCFNKTRAPVDSCWRNIVFFFFSREYRLQIRQSTIFNLTIQFKLTNAGYVLCYCILAYNIAFIPKKGTNWFRYLR